MDLRSSVVDELDTPRHLPKLTTEISFHQNPVGYVFGKDQKPATPNLGLRTRVYPGTRSLRHRQTRGHRGPLAGLRDHGESSRIRDRPGWLASLHYLRPGDT